MENSGKNIITIKTTVNAPASTVWKCWTDPNHVTQWYFASDDWHAPKAENDLKKGGKFTIAMAAKDGSFSFDFTGEYKEVIENKYLDYVLDDGREVKITFKENGSTTEVEEVFEAEGENDPEMQRAGWQAILDNFKKYTENNSNR